MERQEHTIKLTTEQVNTVLAGLQELPYKFSAPVFEAIIRQVQPPQVEKPAAT